MSGQPIKRGSPAPAQISEETIQRMVSLQEAKIGLEIKQADIALRELDHNQKIADKSIQAQAEDRKDERRNQMLMDRNRLVFVGAVVVLVLGFALAALWMDKEALVLDLVKVLLGFIGGWGASIAWRRTKRDGQQDSD